MIQFAKTCAPSYKDAYSRLYDYILTYMRINLHDASVRADGAAVPRNPIEAAVFFALEEAKLNELIFADGSNQLCQFVKAKNKEVVL